jgi:glycosyltransferase involved in cell wall biosynthesis
LVGPSLDILGGQAVQLERLRARLQQVPDLEVDFLPVNPRLPGGLAWMQRIKYVRTLVTETAYIASLVARLRRYDVVHIFSASYFSFVLAPTPALVLARVYGKKSVLNYRSGEADDHLCRWRRTAPRTIRLADRVVVPSGYLVDVFRMHGIEAESIFNIVDLDRFRYRTRAPLRPVFFSNRNLEPLYNVGCVLRAFARVQQRTAEAELIIAGDGSERAALERLAAELGVRNVAFVGRVPPEQMSALYNRADIYLNASDIDNMPGSIIEAFAAGLPVVTTDAGGIPYIVHDGENGILVPRDDDGAMASAALRLLNEPELAARLTTQAHHECSTRYRWDAVRDEWLTLYRGLVTEGVGPTTAGTLPAGAGVEE